MPLKTTYLIGAGASQNAHPIAKSNPESKTYAEALKSFLLNNVDYFKKCVGGTFNFEHLHIKYISISEKCIEYGTPDTYAKWLYENGEMEEYNCLKKLISSYFSFHDHKSFLEEGISSKKDYRILPFLTSILENGQIPDNVKLISWNYDSQIEIAAKNKSSRGHKYLRGFTAWPNSINSFDNNYIRQDCLPFLLHLNGLAGFKYNKATLAEESITPFIEFAATNHEPLLSFSWEASSDEILPSFNESRLDMAKKMVTGTDCLVIIGYSFPFFNRMADKMLFEEMKSSLQKIYFQAKNSNIIPEDLVNKFDLNIPVEKIKMIRDVGQYYIPHEL